MQHLRITTLGKGWHDKDELLLHAVFQLLSDFVAQEQPEKRINWNHSKAYRQVGTSQFLCDRLAGRSGLGGCGKTIRSSFENLRTNGAVIEDTEVLRSW